MRNTADDRRFPFRGRKSTFWLLTALLLSGYISLQFWFPLAAHYRIFPLADIFVLAPGAAEGLRYALLFGLLALGCWGGYRLVKAVEIPTWQIGLAATLFCAPLVATFPFNATDIYRYYLHGRVAAAHGGNPFIDSPAAFPEDGFLILAGEWADFTSPYGPLWELGAAGIARIAGDDLLLALLAFKGLGAAAFLACGALIWGALPDLPAGERRGRLLLWLWNPALLLTFVVNAHNDALMILWLLAGWLLITRQRLLSGWLLLLLGVLTKPIAILALPFFYLHLWCQWAPAADLWAWRPRLALIFGVPLGSLALLLAAFAPFGNPLPLLERLLAEAQGGSSFAPVTLLILSARRWGWSAPFAPLGVAGAVFLALLALWAAWRTLRGRPATAAAADLFTGYVLQAFNFRIWYAAWPLPWLLLDTRPGPWPAARLQAGLAFLYGAQLSVLVYGHVRRLLFNGDYLPAHAGGVALVFLLPLLLLFWRRRRGPSFRAHSGG